VRQPSSPSDWPGATAGEPVPIHGPVIGEPVTLFGQLSGGSQVDYETGDRAWLQAILDFEGALAVALAAGGLIPDEAAVEIAARCNTDEFDAADLGQRAVAAGDPVVPLVRDLTALVPADARPYVHHGATSQDALDTAASLISYRAVTAVVGDLTAAADACAQLAAEHRDTVMAGRTLLRQALPTTFGLKCAGWLVAIDSAIAGLVRIRNERLAVQYGGAAGTLAALGTAGPRVASLLAAELGLAEPEVPWHTDRSRVAELAGAVGVAAGVLGKIAQDVTLLAQTEVGEVSEAKPHEQTPLRSVLITAATTRVPGLVGTLLGGMAQEHERAAGAWHAEWETLTTLLRLLGGAAARARDLLSGLRVHPDRMRHNLDATGGLLLAERAAALLAPALGRTAAQDAVRRASEEAVATGRPLAEILGQPLDPGSYVGAAAEFVDRALAAHRGD
jgi:3-carboxy-cis,cis-muconate cycloisomerase